MLCAEPSAMALMLIVTRLLDERIGKKLRLCGLAHGRLVYLSPSMKFSCNSNAPR